MSQRHRHAPESFKPPPNCRAQRRMGSSIAETRCSRCPRLARDGLCRQEARRGPWRRAASPRCVPPLPLAVSLPLHPWPHKLSLLSAVCPACSWMGEGCPEAGCSQNRLTEGEVKQGCFACPPSCLSTLPLFGAMSRFPRKDALCDSNTGAGGCSQPQQKCASKARAPAPAQSGAFKWKKI